MRTKKEDKESLFSCVSLRIQLQSKWLPSNRKLFSCQNEFFLHIVSCWRDGKNTQKWQLILPFNFRLWHLEPVVPPAGGCRSQRLHEKKVETVHWLTDWTYYNSPNYLCKSANAQKLLVWKITAIQLQVSLSNLLPRKNSAYIMITNNNTLLLFKAASLERWQLLEIGESQLPTRQSHCWRYRPCVSGFTLKILPRKGGTATFLGSYSAMYVCATRVEVHVNQLFHKWSIPSWQHTLLVNTSNLYRIHQKCSKDGQEPGCTRHLTKHDVNTGLLHVMTLIHPWATTNFMSGQTLYFLPIYQYGVYLKGCAKAFNSAPTCPWWLFFWNGRWLSWVNIAC